MLRPGGVGRRARRLAAALLAALLVAAAGGALYLRQRVAASLPQLEGERRLAGLAGPVEVARDARGTPAIRGGSRADVARGLGFVHAQERFFQMDLLRRRAAGELAEIVGSAALKLDREIRVHRFRSVARRVVAAAAPEERALLEAYAAGANAGLAALGDEPFEYILLRGQPAPWRAEDTVLCVLSMFIMLQDETGRRESRLGYMSEALPAPLFAFLAVAGTEWDAPVAGAPLAQPPIPGPEVFDLRASRAARQKAAQAWPADPSSGLPAPERAWSSLLAEEGEDAALGSNNWAVAGSRSADGRAILANDMHLGISVPNTWYRASLAWPEGGVERSVAGVTLPGTPTVVVGSNGRVAWGFTNSYGDWNDLVVLDAVEGDADAYRTPEGPRRIERASETIHVKGAADETLVVEETLWGPVVDRDAHGRRRALRWVAHDVDGVNFHMLGLETAADLESAQRVANLSGIPHQNFVCADASGRIGWTIMGRIPRRVGLDGRLPSSWADGSRRWDGYLAPEEYPRIVDPADGLIWTANARVVDGGMLAAVGDGGYDLGARAGQIRDDLRALDRPTESDMLKVQLDDRALFLKRWQALLLGALTPQALAQDPRRAELRRLAEGWGARAAVDSAGYRLVRGFRLFLMEQVEALLARAFERPGLGEAERPRFAVGFLSQGEGPLWALVTERPQHLLDPRFESWDQALLAAADATIDYMQKECGTLASCTWGRRNTPEVQHPLSRAVPLLGRLLDMPPRPIPGDMYMPRVQNLDEGASERLAVSPGRERDGYFHMPCGESGHPLSPHYGDGHDDWLAGRPTPFLPGPAVRTLRLLPVP